MVEGGSIERLHVGIHGVGGSIRMLMDHAALEETRWDKYGHHNQNRRETLVLCFLMDTKETRACCFGGAGQRMRQWALLYSRQWQMSVSTVLTDKTVSVIPDQQEEVKPTIGK